MSYIHRVLEKTLRRYLRSFSVVGITGPRQSGKSTMLRTVLGSSYTYVNFDDLSQVDRFLSDPLQFLSMHDDRVIFDEVQRVPDLFRYVKMAVDDDRNRMGKFVLTGSSQFAFLRQVSESLAGRIGLLSLLPFQYSEVPSRVRSESIFRGGYPELVIRRFSAAEDWYSSYLDTYLTKDVRALRAIGDMRDFRRCLQMLAARTSQILNMSELSKDLGVSVPTIKAWISVLEASYVVFLLPPHHESLGKRIVRSPKVYFFDTGLVGHLTGIRSSDLFEMGPLQGALFENFIIAEIYKQVLHTRSDAELSFYRTNHGTEVDLIVRRGVRKEFVEIKSSMTFKTEFLASMRSLMRPGERGTLVYRGKTLPSSRDVAVVDYRSYLTREMK